MPETYQIREYLTSDGNSPFAEWLDRLRDIRAKARIRTRLDRARLGNLGDHHSVGEGVSELRIFYGSGYRIYYGLDRGVIILLLCGGTKASQSRDITAAKAYWRDYRSRSDG